MKNNFESMNQEYGKINSYEDLTDTPGDDITKYELPNDNENDEMMANQNFHQVHQYSMKQSSSEEVLLPSS